MLKCFGEVELLGEYFANYFLLYEFLEVERGARSNDSLSPISVGGGKM